MHLRLLPPDAAVELPGSALQQAVFADVGAQDYLFCTEAFQSAEEYLRLLNGDGSSGNLSRTALEGDAEVLVGLHAGTPVDVQAGATSDFFQDFVVDDAATPGTVEVDYVQAASSSGFETARLTHPTPP